jgi:hypothetical protein
MPLINTSVPNLIQGVSQQPDASRFAGQCEEQVNALSSVADGLKKRPNTRHIARLLTTAVDEDSFVHFINRDVAEKYVVIHNGSTIEAWNILDGTKCEINGSTNPFTPPNYLATNTPRQQLKALTVADNTFIVNRDVPVGISPTNTAALEKKGFAYIAQGDYEKKYILKLGGNIAGVVASNAATFTVNVVSYYYSDGWNRFKIESVDIDNAGEGYGSGDDSTLDLTFNWGSLGNTTPASYNSIVVMPVVTASFVDDGTGNGTYKVGSVTVTNQGNFASHDASRTGYDFATDYNASITATVAGDVVSGATYTFSTEGTRDTVASDADTNNIAQSLFSGDYESGYFAEAPLLDNSIFIPTTTEISTGVNGDGYMTATREGNTIILEHNLNDGDFTLTTSDGLAGAGIKGVYKKTDSLTNLPLRAPNNFKVEITGDVELDQDNYWVQFKTHSGEDFGNGAWEETVAPDVPDGVDSSSMPMTIQSVDLNKLEIKTIDYLERGAGDDETNPHPSFVGKTINDIIFFKNRLGFITDESVVFSEAGEFFNFYRTTVSSLIDSDPIDITVSSTKVTNLSSATPFQENLLLFSDNVQFVLKGGDLFTPKTVSVSPATNFSVENKISPIALGSYIYFPFTRGAYTGLRELTLSATTDTYDAIEVTEHVPAYIPKNIIDIAGTTSEDTIVLLSGDEKGSLYIYNYFWNNNQKVLSAWSKFTFTGEVRGMEFIESSLYAIITHNDETNLVEMPLESGLKDANGYVTHLDMRVSATVTNGSDTITLPYTPEDNSVEVYTADGLKLTATNTGATVTLNQAVTEDTEVFVGIPYTMKYTFSEQLFKAKAGNGTSPSNAAKLMVRNGSIYFDDTAYFQVKVTPKARNTSVNTFTPDVVGSTTIGSLSLDSGFYRFPVFTKAQDTTITIENDSALPSNFQSAEFESFVHSRSNRYG